jgi:HSP20 family protein
MNRIFGNLWSEPLMGPGETWLEPTPQAALFPRVEMSETDKHIHVLVEIPGVKKKHINLTVAPDGASLHIWGKKNLAKDKADREYVCAERMYGEFGRTVTLPCEVSQDAVEATLRNGVLEIALTKADASVKGPKHIDIKAT